MADKLRNSNNVADPRVGPDWQEAIAAGLDMSLVELSLQKTPWERLLEHDEALEFADALKAGAKLR